MNILTINLKKKMFEIRGVFGNLHEEKKFLYISNHKAACTTMSNVLSKHGYSARKLNILNICDLNFTFTFVRNPFDRVVSRYEHMNNCLKGKKESTPTVDAALETYFKQNKELDFVKFVRYIQNAIDSHWEQQVDKFERQLDSLSNIDFIGKIENFKKDFDFVCNKIGICQEELPHINKSQRNPYREYYNDETKEIIYKKYSRDISCFNYKF